MGLAAHGSDTVTSAELQARSAEMETWPPDRILAWAAAVGPKTGSEWLGSDQTFACYLMSARPLKASVVKLGTGPLPFA